MKIEGFKPSVSRRWLLLIAGVMWTGVGIALCTVASNWLSHASWLAAVSMGSAGCILGIVAYRAGFLRIAKRNMQRIRMLDEPSWIMAFQSLRSYILMVIMIALGVGLRHSAIAREHLAIVYLTVGSGLFLASLHYYLEFAELIRSVNRQE